MSISLTISSFLRVFLRVSASPRPKALLLLLPLTLSAAQTHIWTQGDASDYDKAILTRQDLLAHLS